MAIALRELIVKAKGVGVKETTKSVDGLGRASDSTQDRLNKANVSAKNTTASFAKMSQGLGGLVHVYATVAANVFALGAAFDVLKRSADLKILESAGLSLSAHLGTNLENVAMKLKDVTQGTLGFKEAMQQANIALAGGIDTKGLEELTAVATKAAAMTGRSVPDAVNRLTQAVIKAEPELVDEFGIILRVQEATDDYAKSIGKTAKELTTAQRSQAILNQVLERGGKITAGIKLEDTVNAFTRLETAVIEFGQSIVKVISGPAESLASVLSNNVSLIGAGFLWVISILSKQLFPLLQNYSQNIVNASSETIAALNNELVVRRRVSDELREQQVILEFTAKKRADLASKTIAGVSSGYQSLMTKTTKSGGDFVANMGALLASETSKLGKAAAKLTEDFKNDSATSFDFLGRRISRSQAAAITELRHGYIKLGSDINGSLDISSATARTIANIRLIKAEAMSLGTEFKIAMVEAFTFGSSSGFIASIKDFKFISKYFTNGTGAAQKFKGVMSGLTSVFGGLISSVFKMIPWVSRLVVVWDILSSIFGPLVTKLGIFSKELEENEKRISKLTETIESNAKVQKLLLVNLKEVPKTMEDAGINAKRLSGGFADIESTSKSFIEVLDNAEQGTTVDNFFEAIWDGIYGLDSEMEKVVNQFEQFAIQSNDLYGTIPKIVREMNGLSNEIGITIKNSALLHEMSQNFKLVNGQVILTTASIKALASAMDNLDIPASEIKDIHNQIAEKVSLAKKGTDSYSSALQNLSDVTKEMNEDYNELLNSFSETTPFSKMASQLNKVQESLEAAGATITAKKISKTKELANRLMPGRLNIDKMLGNSENKDVNNQLKMENDIIEKNLFLKSMGIKTTMDLQKAIQGMQEKEAAYITTKSKQSQQEAELAKIRADSSLTTIDKIEKEFEALELLDDLKVKTFNAEIARDQMLVDMKLKSEDADAKRVGRAEQTALNAKKAAFKKEQEAEVLARGTKELKTLEALSKLSKEYWENRISSLEKFKSLKLDDLDPKQELVYLKQQKALTIQIANEQRVRSLSNIGFLEQKLKLEQNIEEQERITRKIADERLSMFEQEIELLNSLMKLEDERIDKALKGTNVSSVFTDKGMKALGDSLAKEAREFDKQILSVGERFRDGMLNGMDAAIDSFAESFDKWVTGEGNLSTVFADMGLSMLDAIREQSIGLMTDSLKSIGRQMLGNLIPGSGSLFQTKEEQMLDYNRQQTDYLAIIAGRSGGIFGSMGGGNPVKGILNMVDQQGVKAVDALDDSAFDLNGSIMGVDDVMDSGGKMFDQSFGVFGEIFQKGSIGVANGINALTASLSSGGGGGGFLGSLLQIGASMFMGSYFSPNLGSAMTGMVSSTSGVTSTSSGAISGASAIPNLAVAATGGVTGPKSTVPLRTYADGGIARSPQLSLYGEAGPEAFVPLPDGRTIPVTMDGSSGSTINNVSVVVNVDNNGKAEDDRSTADKNSEAQIFGNLIKVAVVEEIAKQKRPGGMLY